MLAELVGLVASGHDLAAAGEGRAATSRCGSRSGRATIVEEKGLAQVSDEGALAGVVDQVLAANTRTSSTSTAPATTRLKKKKRGFLMGELMEATQGQRRPPSPEQTARRPTNVRNASPRSSPNFVASASDSGGNRSNERGRIGGEPVRTHHSRASAASRDVARRRSIDGCNAVRWVGCAAGCVPSRRCADDRTPAARWPRRCGAATAPSISHTSPRPLAPASDATAGRSASSTVRSPQRVCRRHGVAVHHAR